jgi:hypothetical protein
MGNGACRRIETDRTGAVPSTKRAEVMPSTKRAEVMTSTERAEVMLSTERAKTQEDEEYERKIADYDREIASKEYDLKCGEREMQKMDKSSYEYLFADVCMYMCLKDLEKIRKERAEFMSSMERTEERTDERRELKPATEREAECPVCFETKGESKLLRMSCDIGGRHHICRTCHLRIVEMSRLSGSKTKCPMCRQEYTV